ncbi:hypothetical protein KSP40_PGU018282 [Platanthera guangdongensis]|uniref:Beta-1,3-glucanase n=1 Tax=Platanthera guangdongensis TaxID=2320717 RepID=A0ABR2M654_9ASPA
MLGDNLPSPSEVISLCKSRNISKLRMTRPSIPVLEALRNTGIGVILSPYKEELLLFALRRSAAVGWVEAYIVPFASSVDFRYISIGNEDIPGDNSMYILTVIQNVANALRAANLYIPVTTTVSMEVLGTSYKPSEGVFSDKALEVTCVLEPIIYHLALSKAPLLVNVYPYYAYVAEPDVIELDYVLFTTRGVVVEDGNRGYSNMFDAMVDAMRTALERAGGAGVEVVVSETGWPSFGGKIGATIHNAKTYNNNLVKHVKSKIGTPKFPEKEIEVYLFSMFNENLKPEGIKRNYGLFYANMTEDDARKMVGIAQLVEQRIENPRVTSSNLVPDA